MPMQSPSPETHVMIVGAGFAGLGMGIRLKRAGIESFTIFEQADEVGGTWRDNHYPGAGCDIPSHLYSFSFEPYPRWSRSFADQKEIWDYLIHCSEKYDLRRHIRFGTAIRGARFDEGAGLWSLDTSSGETVRGRVVVSGTGGLSRPAMPAIAGLDRFGGPTFHSARWRHDVALDGKTVAVIGTGASAIQLVPQIAPRPKRLHLFQRTPAWIIPKLDRPISRLEQRLFAAFPAAQQVARAAIYWELEPRAAAFVLDPRWMKIAKAEAMKHLRTSVYDPALRAKLTPDYTIGCKRILLSNDFYPAVQRSNVELVTEGIREITARGVVTDDGVERPVDVIVCSTGFQAAEAVAPFGIAGRRGSDLNETWRDGAEAYLGTTVSGFPNAFLIVGPNTGLGHNSMVFIIESQIEYIAQCIETIRARGLKFIDVRRDVQDRYNEELQRRLAKTVWASGCKSWYQTRSGKNTTLWPGFTFEFRRRTSHLDLDDYELHAEYGTPSLEGADAPISAAPLPAE